MFVGISLSGLGLYLLFHLDFIIISNLYEKLLQVNRILGQSKRTAEWIRYKNGVGSIMERAAEYRGQHNGENSRMKRTQDWRGQ